MLASSGDESFGEIPAETSWLCTRCGVALYRDDRFCGNCGAPAQAIKIRPDDRGDLPVERGVHLTDWISLALLTIGGFGLGSVAAIVWERRSTNPLPQPIASPLMAGVFAAATVFVVGIV